jgi:hypothetical protein
MIAWTDGVVSIVCALLSTVRGVKCHLFVCKLVTAVGQGPFSSRGILVNFQTKHFLQQILCACMQTA